MKKPPIYQKFEILANKGTWKGKPIEQVLIHYDTMTELTNAMRKLFREGYTDMYVTVKGIYGRRSIPWSEQ